MGPAGQNYSLAGQLRRMAGRHWHPPGGLSASDHLIFDSKVGKISRNGSLDSMVEIRLNRFYRTSLNRCVSA